MKNIISVMICVLLWSCGDDKPISPNTSNTVKKLIVNFEYKVSNENLVFDSKKYISPANDTFNVQNFKFYIIPLGLYNANDSVKFIRQFYTLIDPKSNKNQMVITLASDFSCSKLKLAIGVDSINNHRIDFTGDLNPNNDMAWDWNTGYKFLLLEGYYWGQTSKGPLVFHIGTDANYRIIKFDLGQTLNIESSKIPSITIKVNVNGIFESPNLVDFDLNNNEMFGTFTEKIANNYTQNLLSISHINQ